ARGVLDSTGEKSAHVLRGNAVGRQIDGAQIVGEIIEAHGRTPFLLVRASQVRRSGQPASIRPLSSRTRQRGRPPRLSRAGMRAAAWSRHQLASDRPHIETATWAGTSRAWTVAAGLVGVVCCEVGAPPGRAGGLASTFHPLPLLQRDAVDEWLNLLPAQSR